AHSFHKVFTRLTNITAQKVIRKHGSNGICEYDFDSGVTFFEKLPNPRNSASGGSCTYEMRNFALALLVYFRPKCKVVSLRVSQRVILINVIKQGGVSCAESPSYVHVVIRRIFRQARFCDYEMRPIGFYRVLLLLGALGTRGDHATIASH